MHQPRRQCLLLIHRLQQDWLAAVPGDIQPHAPALGMPQGILAKHKVYGSSKGLSPCMAPLCTRNSPWGVGRVGTGAAGTSLRGLPAPQLRVPQPPPPHEYPFYRLSKSLSLAGLPSGEPELAPTGQCSARSINLTASVDIFPRESPPKWVRPARMDTREHELSRQLPVTGEPDLRLQEGAISSTHSPSDNNPGTAPSSAAPDMVRMLNEWA